MEYCVDYNKSLKELTNLHFDKEEFRTHLIQTCEELCDKPLSDYSVEDLRIMIGQNIGLEFLIPLAIEELEMNLLASGDLYPGDLLNSVLKSDPQFWFYIKR